jgi:hypothetical protein
VEKPVAPGSVLSGNQHTPTIAGVLNPLTSPIPRCLLFRQRSGDIPV